MDDYMNINNVPANGVVIVDSLNSDYTPNADSYDMVFSSNNQTTHLSNADTLMTRHHGMSEPAQEHFDQQIQLGDRQLPRVAIPNLDDMEVYLLPLGFSIQHVLKFIDLYTENCSEILENIKRLKFNAVKGCWERFWRGNYNSHRSNNIELTKNVDYLQFEQEHIFQLANLPQIRHYIETLDIAFYQVITEVLFPDILRTTLTIKLSIAVRTFSNELEDWLRAAMCGAPTEILEQKISSAQVLAVALMRYTSFSHMASVARQTLDSEEEYKKMYQDFAKVNFTLLKAQAGWVTNCDPGFVSNLQNEFLSNLRKRITLDGWMEWLEAVVEQSLSKYQDKSIEIQDEMSRLFLLNLSFYSSMVVKDLTCRSAGSFGSFHLIRLLYDEYVFLLVEMRLAKATNQPMLSVLRPNWLQPYLYQQQILQQQQQQQQQQTGSNAGNNNTNLIDYSQQHQALYPIQQHLIPVSLHHDQVYTSVNNNICNPATTSAAYQTTNSNGGIHYVLEPNNMHQQQSQQILLASPQEHQQQQRFSRMHSLNAESSVIDDEPSLEKILISSSSNCVPESSTVPSTMNSQQKNGNPSDFMLLNHPLESFDNTKIIATSSSPSTTRDAIKSQAILADSNFSTNLQFIDNSNLVENNEKNFDMVPLESEEDHTSSVDKSNIVDSKTRKRPKVDKTFRSKNPKKETLSPEIQQ